MSSSCGRLTSRPRVEGTMQYAQAQLQPTEICSHPWNGRVRRAGQVSGEALELEVALGGQRVAREELGELVHLPGSEGDVDEREALEHLLLDRLRPAAADADDPLRLFALQALGLAQMGDEAAVGRLADRARIEEDQVGLPTLWRLGVAERLEHPLHSLRVVLVHLAAEGGEVIALHRLTGYLRLPSSTRPCGDFVSPQGSTNTLRRLRRRPQPAYRQADPQSVPPGRRRPCRARSA